MQKDKETCAVAAMIVTLLRDIQADVKMLETSVANTNHSVLKLQSTVDVMVKQR